MYLRGEHMEKVILNIPHSSTAIPKWAYDDIIIPNDELDSLNRLVMIFLESAELRIKNRRSLTMDFWRSNVDQMLEFNGFKILNNAGSISSNDMKQIVSKRYEVFNQKRKVEAAMQADLDDLQELKLLEESLISRPKDK